MPLWISYLNRSYRCLLILGWNGRNKDFLLCGYLKIHVEILLYCAKKEYRNLIKEASSHVVLKLHDCIRNRVLTFKYYGVIEY